VHGSTRKEGKSVFIRKTVDTGVYPSSRIPGVFLARIGVERTKESWAEVKKEGVGKSAEAHYFGTNDVQLVLQSVQTKSPRRKEAVGREARKSNSWGQGRCPANPARYKKNF